MQHVETIAAAFVLLSGIYLVYYFLVVDISETSDPVTTAVENLQTSILTRLSDNWQLAAIALGGVVASAIAFAVWRREPPAPGDVARVAPGDDAAPLDGSDQLTGTTSAPPLR
jgi:hypothetical protein